MRDVVRHAVPEANDRTKFAALCRKLPLPAFNGPVVMREGVECVHSLAQRRREYRIVPLLIRHRRKQPRFRARILSAYSFLHRVRRDIVAITP